MSKLKPKLFTSNENLITLLKARNMSVRNERRAAKILEQENYYYLINGYNTVFLVSKNPEDTYRDRTTFFEVLALYKFDQLLREKLLINLLKVEHIIKTRIIYVFSKYHEHDHTAYLNLDSFNQSGESNKERATNIIGDMNRLIVSSQKKHRSISHYMEKHGYVPLWVLSKVMTFGRTNSFYSCLQNRDKQEIASAFNLNPRAFKCIIDFLSTLRNKCAHGERIYCHINDITRSRPILGLPEHRLLKIPTSRHNRYQYGIEDILALLICLRYFLSPYRYDTLLKEINHALNTKLKKRLKSIDITVIKNIMGLNCGWFEILRHYKESHTTP